MSPISRPTALISRSSFEQLNSNTGWLGSPREKLQRIVFRCHFGPCHPFLWADNDCLDFEMFTSGHTVSSRLSPSPSLGLQDRGQSSARVKGKKESPAACRRQRVESMQGLPLGHSTARSKPRRHSERTLAQRVISSGMLRIQLGAGEKALNARVSGYWFDQVCLTSQYKEKSSAHGPYFFASFNSSADTRICTMSRAHIKGHNASQAGPPVCSNIFLIGKLLRLLFRTRTRHK